MFGRQSEQGLSLEIGDRRLYFSSVNEFEFALAGRTCLPPSKLGALMGQSDARLMREAEGIRAVEQRFSDALSGVLKDVTSISPFLKELDIGLISQDHEWRQIMVALNQTGRDYEEFKKVALVKYMQYLTSRQNTIQSVYDGRAALRAAKLNLAQAAGHKHTDADGGTGTGTGTGDGGDGSGLSEEQFRSTVLFRIKSSASDASLESTRFGRLPKGETVEFSLEKHEAAPLLLAQHRCSFVQEDRLLFIDNQGRRTNVHAGKSIIGRDLSCDIVMDPGLREVSRKHLIVEFNDSLIRLTDISSHGTSVPEEFLENTSI